MCVKLRICRVRYDFSLTHHALKNLVRCAQRQHNGNKAGGKSTPGHLLQRGEPPQRSVLAFCLPYVFFLRQQKSNSNAIVLYWFLYWFLY